jgi:hypothetical protein
MICLSDIGLIVCQLPWLPFYIVFRLSLFFIPGGKPHVKPTYFDQMVPRCNRTYGHLAQADSPDKQPNVGLGNVSMRAASPTPQ